MNARPAGEVWALRMNEPVATLVLTLGESRMHANGHNALHKCLVLDAGSSFMVSDAHVGWFHEDWFSSTFGSPFA